jgi:hypothetical protein
MIDRVPSMAIILVLAVGSIGLMCAQPSKARDLPYLARSRWRSLLQRCRAGMPPRTIV